MKSLLTRTRPPESEPARLGLGGDVTRSSPGEAGGDETGGDELTPAALAGVSWTGGPRWRTHAATAAICLGLLTGPVALGMMLTRPAVTESVAGDTPAQVDDRTARQGAATEIATRWVRAYLAASRDTPGVAEQMWGGPLDLPDTAAQPTNVTAVAAIATGPGAWTVWVGADLPAAGSKGTQRRWFTVVIGVDGGVGSVGAKPLTLPAEVAAPPAASAATLDYSNPVPTGSGLDSATQSFMTALLTPSGDITPLLAPGVSIARVTPSPYRSASVQLLQASDALPDGVPADGIQAHLLVTVQATSTTGGRTTLQYLLTLTSRAGRWEISSLDVTPQLISTN